MSDSAVYEGWVRHRRFEPIEHSFRYPLFLMYLDLDELPGVLDPYPLFSARRSAPAHFLRNDYMGDPDRPLAECARDAVEAETGSRPAGPVRLLANLRYLGHVFNPVSFYYCFAPGGERVEALVAEVTNTPWGERHAYVIGGDQRDCAALAGEFDKALHVSPFMGMDHRYEARAAMPAQTLSVHISSSRAGVTVFDATLALRRRELTRASIVGITGRYPLATMRVLALIYAHALGLKLAGVPVHRHPQAGRA
jgi:uncharacterized protein